MDYSEMQRIWEQIEAERQRLAAEEAERQRLAAEEAERQRLAAEEAERQRLAAEEAERQRQAQQESLYARAARAGASFLGLFGMGDAPLDADQGRALRDQGAKLYAARQAQERERLALEAQQARELTADQGQTLLGRGANLYAARRQQEQERLDQEAQQAREMMAEAQRISEGRNALQQAPQGVEGALEGVYSAAEKRESSLPDSPYADVLRRGDYGRYSQAGESRLGLGADTDRTYDYINDINGFRARADEQAVMANDTQRLGRYGLMTDDEIGVYNYLYATQGRESAEKYLEELEPELNRQYYSGLKNSTLEDVDDGKAGLSWNEAGASVLTVLEQPVRSVNSALANIEDAYRAATGQGIDPYSQFRTASRLTQDVREGISDDMGEVGSFAYQTAMSALDSTVNALVAQGVGEGLGFGGDMASQADVERLQRAVNALGSLTMSNEVMAMSVAESKEKGYSDIGALSLGFVRGAIEYLSEKWGGEWIINKAKGNPSSLLYAIKSAMIPEGTEEVMSDAMNEVVNYLIDVGYGTEESYIYNAWKYWKDQGAGNGKATAMTLATIIQQEALSFAGGAFAAAGSGVTNYRSNSAAFKDTASRLNTNTEGVVQLMRDIGAEDVFQVAELAELYDADSAEQLREQVKAVGDAAKAIDERMRAQAAGEERSTGAQDDTGERATARVAPTGNETTGQETGDTSSPAARELPLQGKPGTENAPAGTAEAVESAAQNGADDGRASVNMNTDARVNTAKEMLRQGKSPSEVFNKTGLVVRANGTIQDGIGGPILNTGGAVNDQGEDVGNNTGNMGGPSGSDTLTGGSGKRSERVLRPTRSWTEFTEQDRRKAIDAINRHADSDPDSELSLLRKQMEKSGIDADTEIARRVYQDLQMDPIVAENNWGSLFNDIDGLLAELSGQGGENGQESIGYEPENGNADQRAGGQAGAEADQQDAGAGSRGQGEVPQGVPEAGGPDLRNGREVTPAELGIPKGSDTDTITVLDMERQSENVRAAADQVRSAGLEPVAFAGDLRVNGVSVNGYIQNGKVYFRTDGTVDSDSIVKHELFHQAADADQELVGAVNDMIRGKMSREEFLQLEQEYFESYKDLYAWENMDDDSVQQRIHEEIGADAYAGMNRFGEGSRVAQAVRADIAGRVQQAKGNRTPNNLTYEGLIKKSPMRVTVLEENADMAGGKKRGDILRAAKENIREKNNPLNTDKHQFIKVADTGYDLRVSAEGLRHGIAKLTNRSGKATAAVTQKIGDVLTNAIKVNEMQRKANDPAKVKGSDVLLGYAEDGQSGYVVRAIASLSDEGAELTDIEVFPLLSSVKAKKVDSPIVHTASTENGRGQDPQATYNISIQQLLDLVKEQYPDILSDDALTGVGSSREKALAVDGSLKSEMRYSADTTNAQLETRETTEEAKQDLLEVGEGKVKNDTGEYRMTIRRKNDGHYLASVDFNGKRSQARTFGTAAEAAEWAAGTVDGQTRARQDAEMDRHKSEKKKGPTLTQQLFGQFDPEAEARRQKENRAAEAATQTLRSRVRNTQEEINALNRLERTTGLTEAQKSHRADLQQTLEIMNDELESRKKKRGEARAKERVEVKGNKPTQSVADARRTIMDMFHTPEGLRQSAGTAIQERLEAMLRDGRVDERSKQSLFGALIDAGMVPKAADPTFRQIREDLSGRRYYVSEQDRKDFGDGWKDLYQRAWGARIFLTNNPTDTKIDAVNREMADVYGENMFPTDAALSDMLDNLIDKAEKGKDGRQKLTEAIEDEAKYTDTEVDEIYEDMFNRLDEQLRTFAKKAGLEVQLKDKAASDMATERKRWEDRMERKAQERRESKIREKVLKGLQRLERLKGKAAPEVRTQIDEVLKDIDTQARSLTPYGIENLQALQKVYEEKAQQEGFVSDDEPGNFIRNPYVEEQLKRLSQKHLNEMDIADVIALGNAVSGLVNTVQTANRMIGEEFDASVKETAEGWDSEIKESRGAKEGSFLQKWFSEEQLSPRRFLNMLSGWKQGGIGQKLAASLENGQTRMLDFQRKAMQSFDPFMSKKENQKWLKTASGKNAKWSTYSVVNGMDMEGKSGYSGQEIEITPMMKIALYLHSLNDDNLRHIQTGGLVIPNKALYQKGKIAEAYAQGQKVKMQPEAVRAIASTLTAEEKTFAGYLQKFFNEQSKAAINEVSLQLDGFERAGVADYFPIETDSSFLKSDVAGEARSQTVEGIGSIANERVHAGNPIRLCDASDVLARQIDKVSRYYGYAIPIRNFQAVNNFTFHEEGNAFAGSIKDTMNKKWGSGAQQYITKMLADIQSGGGSKTDMLSRGLAWLRGNMAGATLSINPSVAVSQTASYPGAAQVVGWDGLAAGLAGGKVDEKLVEKYSPLLWYRSQGYSTQELGDAKAANNKTLGQKALNSKVLNWIQGMDRATVKRLWAAAEYRVTKDTGMKPGSKAQIEAGTDPYYKAVAEVFNRAVYDTQPNYTNMERAQILRSDSQLTKMLTMYKTVPLQYYGMMYEAMGRLRAAQNGTEAEQKAARKYAADTVSGLIAANTLYVAVKAAFKSLRGKDDDYRDDEGELTAESVTKQLGKDLLETTAGSIIGGAEAYSIIDGWAHGKKFSAPEISALSHVEDVVNDINNIFKAIDADDPRKTAGAVKTAAETLAMTWGVPVKNAETYLTAIVGRVAPMAAMEYNNLFGGIDKSDMKKLDDDTVGMAANIIIRNRTGAQMNRAATDELSRLYKAGYNTSIPAEIPESFSYGGNEVKIKDRGAYGDTWGGVVGDNLEELLASDSYSKADDKTKAAMVNHLYQYATVQARMGADPEYSAEGNSTYGWTVKADEAVEAGIDLPTAIGALVTMNGMTSDKEAGRTVVSKKSKVVDYINGLDLDDEQKDVLYGLAGYTSGLEYAPWHTGIDAGTGYTSGSGPKVHEGTKKEVIAKYNDALTGSAAYKAADDQTKKAMVKLLQDYATAQGMKKTDPSWTPAGTEYNWTTWADTALEAGIDLPSAIAAKIELGKMKADYDKYGKAITGSKKEKVCAYIDGLDLTPEQKDVLYLSVYKENSLPYTPWHGYKKKTSTGGKRRSGRRSGGRRSSGNKKTTTTAAATSTSAAAKAGSGGIDVSKLFGGTGKKYNTDASQELLAIIDKYYGGDAFAAALDGGRAAKGITKVDFKL